MTVPLWFFLVVLVWAVVATFARLIRKKLPIPLPFPDQGFRIFVTTDQRAMNATAIGLGVHGLVPKFRLNSASVKRVIFDDGMTILNVVDPYLLEKMGDPGAAIAHVVHDPYGSALELVSYLRARGYTAELAQLPEVESNQEAMYYVKSDAFHHWVVIFRLHMIKMGRPEIVKY